MAEKFVKLGKNTNKLLENARLFLIKKQRQSRITDEQTIFKALECLLKNG